MLNAAVARRYAKALQGAVLEVGGDAEAVAAELELLSQAITRFSGLESLILNPAVEADKKAAVLVEVADRLEAGDLSKRFIGVLAERERLDHLAAAVTEYRAMVDAEKGIVNAEVTSPAALDENAITDLRSKLAQATGSEVRLSTQTDPELLGGLVTRIGDQVYDGSLRHQLERMRHQLSSG